MSNTQPCTNYKQNCKVVKVGGGRFEEKERSRSREKENMNDTVVNKSNYFGNIYWSS